LPHQGHSSCHEARTIDRAAAIANKTVELSPSNRCARPRSLDHHRQRSVSWPHQGSFRPHSHGKSEILGSEVMGIDFAADDPEMIGKAVRGHLSKGCDLLLLSGGMSVDPDDVTRHGIRLAGATEVHYGSAVLPGAMFLVAYIGDLPLLGVPACALYHKTTILDLVLPRILAGEHVTRAELAFLATAGCAATARNASIPTAPLVRAPKGFQSKESLDRRSQDILDYYGI